MNTFRIPLLSVNDFEDDESDILTSILFMITLPILISAGETNSDFDTPDLSYIFYRRI
jgi:hypothetical protein